MTRLGMNTNLTGCSLLLLQWSYERVYVDKLGVNHSPYKHLYSDYADGPTMATLWCSRLVGSFPNIFKYTV
jgi:hypothetical protein